LVGIGSITGHGMLSQRVHAPHGTAAADGGACNPVRVTKPPVDRWWYTVRDGADLETVAAICRATLDAQRHRLGVLYVDILSDEPWPPDVLWAVDELSALAVEQGRKTSTGAALDPQTDRHMELAAAIAPYTIGVYGISDARSEGVTWSVHDTGSSCAFELRPEELAAVHGRLDVLGLSRDDLILFEVGRRTRWRRTDAVRLGETS
jgi:hypothetical protein